MVPTAVAQVVAPLLVASRCVNSTVALIRLHVSSVAGVTSRIAASTDAMSFFNSKLTTVNLQAVPDMASVSGMFVHFVIFQDS